jgi:hypothetical protein
MALKKYRLVWNLVCLHNTSIGPGLRILLIFCMGIFFSAPLFSQQQPDITDSPSATNEQGKTDSSEDRRPWGRKIRTTCESHATKGDYKHGSI